MAEQVNTGGGTFSDLLLGQLREALGNQYEARVITTSGVPYTIVSDVLLGKDFISFIGKDANSKPVFRSFPFTSVGHVVIARSKEAIVL